MERNNEIARYFARLTDAIIAGQPQPEPPIALNTPVINATPTESAEPAESNVVNPVPTKDGNPKKKFPVWIIFVIIGVLAIAGAAGGFFGITGKAADLFVAGDYQQAKDLYSLVPGYGDMVTSCDYAMAKEMMENRRFEESREAFLALGDYKDSVELSEEALYRKANLLMDEKNYLDAMEVFSEITDGYKDVAELADECCIEYAIECYRSGDYNECLSLTNAYPNNETAKIYKLLASFRLLDQTGCSFEACQEMYDELLPYQFINNDTREAFTHPFFFVLRFYDVLWKCDSEHFILWDEDEFSCAEPWESVPGVDISYINYDDGLYFLLTDDSGTERVWFKVGSFDGYVNLHPQMMFVYDADGNMYTFYNESDDTTPMF